jgi:hypothetical protein
MDVIAPSNAPIPNQVPGASLRAGNLWFSWIACMSFFPMRQQQTGMYWLSIHPNRNYDKASGQ